MSRVANTRWPCLLVVRSGVPFVTSLYLLPDPLCLATLNTDIPFVGPFSCNSDSMPIGTPCLLMPFSLTWFLSGSDTGMNED
eukprot:352821-Chlamydomonas_euryale.AAC.3